MKIAEALMVRADLTKRIASLQYRAGGNTRVQEGDEPNEDPNELAKEAFRLMQEFEELVERINRTNTLGQISSGETITAAMAARDRMQRQHAFLEHVISSAMGTSDYYSNREVRWTTTVNVAGLQKQADDVSRKLRELNTEIQQANWNVDLVE
jgi:hypothetical protein